MVWTSRTGGGGVIYNPSRLKLRLLTTHPADADRARCCCGDVFMALYPVLTPLRSGLALLTLLLLSEINHSSLTPRQLARLRVPNSHLLNVRNVVLFSAAWDVKLCTMRSTTAWGKPGGSSPSRSGSDLQIVSMHRSVSDLGQRLVGSVGCGS